MTRSAGTPPQYIRPTTKSFEPSAGYIGKKTLNKNRITSTNASGGVPTNTHTCAHSHRLKSP
eukprot:5469272-Amphidinium_carterae.1